MASASKTDRMCAVLLSELNKNEVLSTARCMELLNVSESTVRRLFIKLEKNGDAIRVTPRLKDEEVWERLGEEDR